MSRSMKELVQQMREELPQCSFDDGKTWELDGVVIAERLEAAASALESQEEEIALLVDERDALKAEVDAKYGARMSPTCWSWSILNAPTIRAAIGMCKITDIPHEGNDRS